MKISKGVETKEGKFVFQGEISGPELDFLVEFAVNELAKQGALPYVSLQSTTRASIMEAPDADQ